MFFRGEYQYAKDAEIDKLGAWTLPLCVFDSGGSGCGVFAMFLGASMYQRQ